VVLPVDFLLPFWRQLRTPNQRVSRALLGTCHHTTWSSSLRVSSSP
jgi:hypothetical protein